MPEERIKTAARCSACGHIACVRIWEDGTVHPIGQITDCCDDSSYVVLEEERGARLESGTRLNEV